MSDPTRTLTVSLAERSYPIVIGTGVLSQGERIAVLLPQARVLIVTNDTIAPLYLAATQQALRAKNVHVEVLCLPDGEAYKTWESLNRIYDALLAARCDRKITLIALGGGVIGDLTGFAAATYQRGVNFIQIPTTLLSQVDSSVGGKTGINHPRGKNMVGAFWQPKLVLIDTSTLATLPPREFSAGMAEVIKYGLLRDLAFLEWIEQNIAALMARNPDALAYAIERSCRNKAEVVADDEFETAKEGGRALLNLGHTFGHAIETGLGYGAWLHGEAVAAGMVMAADLSQRMGWITVGDVVRIKVLLQRAALPITAPVLDATDNAARYLDLMSHDKKVLDGRLRLVLLKSLGQAVTSSEATREQIAATIEACCHG